MSATTEATAASAGHGHDHDHDRPSHCENCRADLHGHYCHECGQSVHNPVRNFGHAVEEVFESFWHLDGRVFRTLRDLLSPGKVARDYLAGHRVRYLPPLRLFVIASVLTFFVAQFAIHVETATHFDIDTAQSTTVRLGNVKKQMRAAQSVVEVEELRARIVGELRVAAAAAPVARSTIEASIAGVQRQADKRIEALRAEQGLSAQDVASQRAEGDRLAAAPKPGSMEAAKDLAEVERLRDARIARLRDEHAAQAAGLRDASTLAAQIRVANAEAGCRIAQLQIGHAASSEGARAHDKDRARYGETDCDGMDDPISFNGKPWDAKTNPLTVTWWPRFANDWLNRQVGKGEANFQRATKDPALYIHALIGAIPSALFLMVPIFALLLKIAYLGSGRGYLEHLVVALYSHTYLCLALLAMFVLMLLGDAIAPHWAGFAWIKGLGIGLLWLWMPIYLLLMEKRVYANGWALTLLRYTLIGGAYFFLMSLATAGIMAAAIVRM
ncbi:hypothetical protein GLE_4861 [Lysobacter enzymogenes]|uniref:DUF3667 domain-containing protein n=1 Tax=Lysobacter enzymogenes TaxID=69 RepID=A0A0S2DNU8_LYSEN|nr:DUF3667 domain-containing protein [Lysobacter enzymogenes]ALN60202.1 hypothetical protein GLE_4861 [Lysobacter enzymogenes]